MSKNDSKLLTKVSSLIPGQVPEFVETDHSLFVKFLKDYYQFLEAGRITLSTTINYVTLETTTVSYVLNETDKMINAYWCFNSKFFIIFVQMLMMRFNKHRYFFIP